MDRAMIDLYKFMLLIEDAEVCYTTTYRGYLHVQVLIGDNRSGGFLIPYAPEEPLSWLKCAPRKRIKYLYYPDRRRNI